MTEALSRKQPKTKSRKKEAGAPQEALYVYGIGEHQELSRGFEGELPEAIEPDTGLELFSCRGLAAIASRVPLKEYGEAELEKNLNDAEWTAIRAVRHQAVLVHFSSRISLIPLRFGTIYWNQERVEKMLASGAKRFRALIDRLRDKEEWEVNLYADRAKLRKKVVSSSPKLRELSREAASASPGHAYLLQKKVQSLRADEAKARAQEVVEEIESRLSAVSEGTARLQAGREKSERSDAMARLVFLVERGRLDQFRDLLETLADEYTPLGFQFELTGPWPAYNFVSLRPKESQKYE